MGLGRLHVLQRSDLLELITWEPSLGWVGHVEEEERHSPDAFEHGKRPISSVHLPLRYEPWGSVVQKAGKSFGPVQVLRVACEPIQGVEYVGVSTYTVADPDPLEEAPVPHHLSCLQSGLQKLLAPENLKVEEYFICAMFLRVKNP